MQVPRYVIDSYSSTIGRLSDNAVAALQARLAAIDMSDAKMAIPLIKEAFVDICSISASLAARVSALVFNQIKYLQTGMYGDADADSYELEGTRFEDAAAGIVQDLVDGDAESMSLKLLQRVQYETKRASGRSMGKYCGDAVKWARVPQGAETCAFCMVLASRGFAYGSEDSALGTSRDHYHRKCDCVAIPSWDDDGAEGYDPDVYLDYYDAARSYALEHLEELRKRQRSGDTDSRHITMNDITMAMRELGDAKK